MCRFKFVESFFKSMDIMFKYITCVGSSAVVAVVLTILTRLNTSHVSVQVVGFLSFLIQSQSLNTSHVSVQGVGIVRICKRSLV